MKILFIIHLPPPVHGAAAVGLQIKQSKIINEAFDCEYINLSTSITIDEIRKTSFVKIIRYFKIIFKVLFQLIFHKPDLCYISMTANGIAFYKDALLAHLIKFFRIKLVYHFHNKGVSENQEKFIYNKLYQSVFNNAEVVLLSKYLYPDVKKYVDINHVHICPNGIVDVPVPEIKKNAVVQILFLSNLILSKGVFVMLDAFKILKNRKVSFSCNVVGGIGDINQHQFEAKVSEMGLADNVRYLGKKYGKEKDEIFGKSDIFLHPTLNDCFPLVLLEAMQFSLPVISTIEGGIPDIIVEGKTGFLIPPNNIEMLAEKLIILIENPELRSELGNSGRKKYENEFTSNKFERQMTKILQRI